MSTISKSAFLAVEKSLKAATQLKFPNYYKHKVGMPMKDFLWNLINSYNYIWATYKVGGSTAMCATGRHRSLTDIYPMILHYYPDTRLYDVRKLLVDWVADESLFYRYCTTINRGTYYPPSNGQNYPNYRGSPNQGTKDEFGWYWNELPIEEEVMAPIVEPAVVVEANNNVRSRNGNGTGTNTLTAEVLETAVQRAAANQTAVRAVTPPVVVETPMPAVTATATHTMGTGLFGDQPIRVTRAGRRRVTADE